MVVTASPGPDRCTWASDDQDGGYAYVEAGWDYLSFEETAELWSGGTSLTVGGRPAYAASEYDMLWVQLDHGLLRVVLDTTADVDWQAAVEGLAELIVSRAGTLPPLATAEPVPTSPPVSHADPDLEARFPVTIAGQPIIVQSMPGSQVFSSDSAAAFLAQLAADGKTLDDVSVATSFSPSGLIYGIRIKGGDATKYAPLLLASLDTSAQQTPGKVSGKDVTVSTTPTGTQYFYPRNDVIWVVTAAEPALSEVFAALP